MLLLIRKKLKTFSKFLMIKQTKMKFRVFIIEISLYYYFIL